MVESIATNIGRQRQKERLKKVLEEKIQDLALPSPGLMEWKKDLTAKLVGPDDDEQLPIQAQNSS